ncbi:hypothetical protein ABZ726_03385, partial [Streptomyces hundungensis]
PVLGEQGGAAAGAAGAGGHRPEGGRAQLQSPQAASGAERYFFFPRLAWSGGRVFVLSTLVKTPKPGDSSHAALSFGK